MDDLINRAHVKALVNSMWWETIDSIPAVDAVEVVRCRECKVCHKEDEDEFWCYRFGPAVLVAPDDFCSRGRGEDGDA